MLKTVYFDAHHRHKWQCFRIRLVDKAESYAPIAVEPYKIKGQYYAVPRSADVLMIYSIKI